MSRTPRPVNADRAREGVVLLIARAAMNGDPCPTRGEFTSATGVQRRRMWAFLRAVQHDGLIEIEERGRGEGTARRMRVIGGRWTEWTQRRAPAVGAAHASP